MRNDVSGILRERQDPVRLPATLRETRMMRRFPLSLVVSSAGFIAMMVSCGLHGVASKLPREQWSAAYLPLTALLFVQAGCAIWACTTSPRANLSPNDQIVPEENQFRIIHLASLLPVMLLTTDALATYVEFRTSVPISGQTIALIRGSVLGIIQLMWVAALPFCVFVMLKYHGWRVPLPRLILHCSVSLTLAYPLIYVVLMWPDTA